MNGLESIRRKDFTVSAKTDDVSEALAVSSARKGIAGFSEQYRPGQIPRSSSTK
jgi:hypothetical protein